METGDVLRLLRRMPPHPAPPNGPIGTSLLVLGAEARVVRPDGREMVRELLRVAEERRFEVRPPAGLGMATVDFGPGVFHVTLVGAPRSAVDVEFMVVGIGPLRLDAWCSLGAHSGADVRLLDGFGRLVVPDLTARGPRAEPLELSAGRYLLVADARDCATALRIAEPIGPRSLRAAV